MGATRDRIIAEALRLFGERGFAGTSVAQIEKAAGLSPGSGSLYRHFRSKEELLVEAMGAQMNDRGEWAQFLEPDFSVVALLAVVAPEATLVDKLVLLCEIGLGRLDHNRDVTRILMRDNTAPAEALAAFRREEYDLVLSVISRALTELAGPEHRDEDWDATAVVVLSAVAHFWMFRDIFGGTHPSNLEADRYLRSTAELLAARLTWTGTHGKGSP